MFCHKCGNVLSDDTLFCPKCGTKVRSDSSALSSAIEPERQPSSMVSQQEPGRSTLILILGILSLIFLGPILGIPAWIMGKSDLKKIDQGLIPKSERSGTKIGMVLGIIGTFLILIVIVLGIVVAVGITMFSDSAINANRDALSNDLVNLASRTQQFYQRPLVLGGGGKTFDGLTSITILTNRPQNANGTYSIVNNYGGDGPVEIRGIGVEIYNGSPVEVHVVVFNDRDSMFTVN